MSDESEFPAGARCAAVFAIAVLACAGVSLGFPSKASACGSYPNWTPDLCPNEQQYVDYLAVRGITPTEAPVHLSDLGWKICGDLQLGRTREFEANRVYAYNPRLGGNGSRAVVDAAVAILCPSAAGPHYPPPYPPNYNIP